MFDGLFQGMAWVLAGAYSFTRSYGVAIILLTLVVMAFVTPLTLKGTRSMMAMQAFQPEIRRIQQEFKGDRQKQNEELLKFYKDNKINPVGSCLPLLIQAPIFIVLFRVISGLTQLGESCSTRSTSMREPRCTSHSRRSTRCGSSGSTSRGLPSMWSRTTSCCHSRSC